MPLTYNDLIGPKSNPASILNYVNYKRVPIEVVLLEAQALIYAQLRVREMRVSAVLALSLGAYYVALPSGFLEPIALRDRKGISLIPNKHDHDTFLSEAALIERRCYDATDTIYPGTPCFVAIFDERYQFDVKASAARSYDHVYYKTPAALATTNLTNFLTVRYPNIVRVACQAGAASFMKDAEEFQAREAELLALIQAANAESDLSRAS